MNLPDIAVERGWRLLEPHEQDAFAAELQREAPPGHPLEGIEFRAFASRKFDFLLHVSEGAKRYAHVHLTYHEETDPRWPKCDFYTDLEEWVSDRFWSVDIEGQGEDDG